MLLIGNGRVITQDKNMPYVEKGCIVTEDNLIKEIGKTEDLKKKYPKGEFLDVKGKIIMPGMVNTHHHIYSAFARGMNLTGKAPQNFIDILEGLWWKIDKKLSLEDVKYSAYTTYIDCIKNGTTTVFDHHASPGAVRESLFTIGNVAKELGIRSCLCYEVSDRDGQNIMQDGIKENIEFMKYANSSKDNLLKGMFGLHASFTLSDKTLNQCVEAIDTLDGGFHIHTAEGIDDLYDSLEKHGKRVVQRLMDFSILGEKTIAVHCIHVNNLEIDILKETKTNVIHNPESNMGNAVGCAPVIEMMNRGVLLGLGTDGYTSDVFESMKVGNIIHKHHLGNPNVGFTEIPKMLFQNNSKIAAKYFKHPVGVLKAGAYADIIVADYDPLTPMNKDNYNSHILFGLSGKSVETTIVNGKIVMKDRKLQGVDEEKIYEKSRQLASKLWMRI